MKAREVVYSQAARADLVGILRWLAEEATVLSAIGIVDELEQFIDGLDMASERGAVRDDLSPGLRIITHKRAQLAVYVDDDTVTIARIFYGGQDWESRLRP